MKRIFSCICLVLVFLCCGCKDKNSPEDICNSLIELDSYKACCVMNVKRNDRDIKANIEAYYMRPDYYKVIFKNNNGFDQIILKNKDGVFVITPGLDKEFKFNSEWPNNKSHAYLINTVCENIKKDDSKKVDVTEDTLTIRSKIDISKDDNRFIEFQYDLKNRSPKNVKISEDDKEILNVTVTSFDVNVKLTKDDFDENSIKKAYEKTTASTNDKALTVGYVVDGAKLSSMNKKTDTVVMCYKGEKSYTIEIDKNSSNNVRELECYNDIIVAENGFIFKKNGIYRYLLENYDISIYSNDLEDNDVISIIDSIVLK